MFGPNPGRTLHKHRNGDDLCDNPERFCLDRNDETNNTPEKDRDALQSTSFSLTRKVAIPQQQPASSTLR